MKLKIFSGSLALLLLTGCAGSSYFSRDLSPDVFIPYALIGMPAAGELAEAELGESMTSQSRIYNRPGILLDQEIVHTGQYNHNYNFVLTIPKGELHLVGMDEEGTFFQADLAATFHYQRIRDEGEVDHQQVTGGIYLPSNASQPTEIYWLWPDDSSPNNIIHPDISYAKISTEENGKDSFKRELVYTGISQNTLSLLYREFKNDFARPAFSQDLKYDLPQGKIIGYQSARFEIVKATNTNIHYKVIHPLD